MPQATHRLLPPLAAAAGVALLALMDALMKQASLASGAYTASLLRSLIGAALIAPVWLARGSAWPRGRVLALHLERGCVSALMALSWFYALTKMPIAEAMAISFVAPLIALYLARVLLGESISRHAMAGSALGFAGTLVIVGGRVGGGEANEGFALGLASLLVSAMLYAYNFVVIRRQSQLAGPLEVATFHSGVSGLVQLLAFPWLFVMPQAAHMQAIGLAALLTVAGSMVVAWAYARAEAQTLVPLEYTGFVWAALFGFLFFAERVTPFTLAGAALIVAACWIAAPRRPVEPSTL